MWQYDKTGSQVHVKKMWLKKSLETCEFALQDPDTHVIFHPWLQKRLLRLERTLGIPKAEQHTFAHVALRPPVVREFTGIRLDDRDIGKKSGWRSIRYTNKEISVEELCLEHYENQGWKGFHSENGVVTTIVFPFHWFLLTCSLHYCSGISCFFRCREYLRLHIKLHLSTSRQMLSSHCEEVRLMCAWQKSRMARARKF